MHYITLDDIIIMVNNILISKYKGNSFHMNYTPKNTQPQGYRQNVSRARTKDRKTKVVYRIITIVLAVLLVISIDINIALLIARKNSDNGGGAESSSTSTASPESTSADDTPQSDPLAPYKAEIESLRQMLLATSSSETERYADLTDLYNSLIELLVLENRPIHNHAVEYTTNEAGEEVPVGEPLRTTAKVSFAYLDLTSGYNLSYNADDVIFAASLIKAPYIYSALLEVEAFEYNKKNFAVDGTPLYAEDGTALFEGTHPNYDENGKIIYLPGEEKYDLTRTWTYTKGQFVEGSGMIQFKDDGFSLSYLELIEYALKYSDNIAFDVLTKTFGRDCYNTLAEKLGTEGYKKGFMQLSASDCAKFMKEIYAYMESGSTYGALMKNAMTSTQYSVMITPAVEPYVCAHKYGWDIDAYHDMAVVYHEKPFVLVIMTDLDEGAAKDYLYIQRIAKNLLSLHNHFYGITETEVTEEVN